MPKPNYQYEKRQRELEKKRKKEDKALKKAAGAQGTRAEDVGAPAHGGPDATTEPSTPG
jgi:hypothetical protein